jgi:Zn-dependent protease with chaperone function
MKTSIKMKTPRRRCIFALMSALALWLMPLGAFAQGTHIVAPKNKYSVQDDIKLGQQAAAQVREQLPLLNDPETQRYIESIGYRLVDAIPPEYQHPEFRYTFQVVNVRDLNAFALPGGPMFVNRGIIQAAENEGELAGVMAHELSHVVLRHGTAQATKAQKYEVLGVLGAITGAVVGGGLGEIIGQGSQLGVGVYFLKFSREYETQADILGSQIMARAGYNPQDLARMFQLLERQGGASGPQFLSDHPNPANRYQRINQEAALLRNYYKYRSSYGTELASVQEHLRGMGRAPTTQEAMRSGNRYPNSSGGPSRLPSGRVEYPSASYRSYTSGNLFRVSVPSNWRDVADNEENTVTFAPNGAYGTLQNGQFVFTHGVQLGVAQTSSYNLQQATDQLVNALLQNNGYLRAQGRYQRGTIDGRSALALRLGGVSDVTGRGEAVTIYTTMLRNGGLFYMIAVAPQDEAYNYQRTFDDIRNSIRLND